MADFEASQAQSAETSWDDAQVVALLVRGGGDHELARRVAGMIGEAVPRPLKAASRLSPAIKRSPVTP